VLRTEIIAGFYMGPRASPCPNPESGTEKAGMGFFGESSLRQGLLILGFDSKIGWLSVAGLFEQKQAGIVAIALKVWLGRSLNLQRGCSRLFHSGTVFVGCVMVSFILLVSK